MQTERREHRRLDIRLPIECGAPGSSADSPLRANTSNISTGGVYFEVELSEDTPAPAPQTLLNVDLTVPPGEGHFPYEGRISTTAEIMRCESLDGTPGRRLAVAARFCEPLKLEF